MLCRCCGEERDTSRFAPGNRVCRPCKNAKKQATRDPAKHRQYAKTSYHRNSEAIRERQRDRYHANIDAARARSRSDREARLSREQADPELRRVALASRAARARSHYAKNRALLLGRQSQQRAAKKALAKVSALKPLDVAPLSAAPVVPLLRIPKQRRLTDAERALRRRLKNQRKWAKRRGAPGRITAADVQYLEQASGGRCFYCATKFGEAGYHIDHYVALSRGGTNYRENLRLACAPCNIAKSDMPAEEFVRVQSEKRVRAFLSLAGDLPGELRQKAVNVMRDSASIMAKLIDIPLSL